MIALSPHEAEVLLSLDRSFQPIIVILRNRAHDMQLPVTLESGYRSAAYQQVLVEHPELHPGTPAAAAGMSKHERGFACDFDLRRVSRLDVVRWGMLVESLGLVWGGRFHDKDGKATPDNGHVEAPFTLEQLDSCRLITAWGL